jgi:hypothetical protein
MKVLEAGPGRDKYTMTENTVVAPETNNLVMDNLPPRSERLQLQKIFSLVAIDRVRFGCKLTLYQVSKCRMKQGKLPQRESESVGRRDKTTGPLLISYPASVAYLSNK